MTDLLLEAKNELEIIDSHDIPDGLFFDEPANRPWTASDLFARSCIIGVDAANLLQDRRGLLMQFGIDEFGEVTWMDTNDEAAQSIISIEYQANAKLNAFAWQLSVADKSGCEKTKFFVTDTGLKVFKTTHDQLGSITSEEVPVHDYEIDLSHLMLIVNSEELAERIAELNATKQKSEENLGALAIELTQRNFDKRKIKKKMDEQEKGLNTFGFGKISPIAVNNTTEIDIEPRVAYTNFQTGEQMMFDPVTRTTYWVKAES